MATIKDVAKLAGVSLGTVSNVINGVKSVNSDLILRVENAMVTLGYQPDAKARSLKHSLSKNVGVVLPNITDASFAQIYAGLEKELVEKGYTVSLSISNELAQNEKRILRQLQQQRMDGAIIVTCQPAEEECFDQLIQSGTKLVFLERRPVNLENCTFACLNSKQAIYGVTQSLLQKGLRRIVLLAGKEEYSNEQKCRGGFELAMREHSLPIGARDVVIIEAGKENAFRAAARWLLGGDVPEAIIATCPSHAEGVLAAVSYFCGEVRPLVAGVTADSWSTERVREDWIPIPQKYLKLGQCAANALLYEMEGTAISDCRDIVVESAENDGFVPQYANKQRYAQLSGRSLRVLMLDSLASNATRMLLCDFERKTGIDVTIDVFDYGGMYDEIVRASSGDSADVFQIDVPWLGEFAARGMLYDLTGHIRTAPRSIEGLIPGTLEEYALHDGKFYGVPYLFDSQLLYYRKDVFEDMRVQRLFFEQTKTELQPPRTWSEYNTVARFFTKSINPDSPTTYGTTLGGRVSSGAVCEFLTRQWAFGGNCFDSRGRVIVNRSESLRALKNYVECFDYAQPTAPGDWWGEQVKLFGDGQAAMMVMFLSHATDIADRNLSQVGGKIGFSMVPGGAPLLGGWSLGVNANSRNPDAAYEFLSWTCDPKIAIPYTILGGSPASLTLINSAELSAVYPWLPKAEEAFSISRKRSLPMREGKLISERSFERILGGAVHAAIVGPTTPEQALQAAEHELARLL